MKKLLITMISIFPLTLPAPIWASSLLDQYAYQAKQEFPDFKGFSTKDGEVFFLKNHNMGKIATPACTSCHGESPKQIGSTRAGKTIAPLAISISPQRYMDKAKVEKWFNRNCNSILGRACTVIEKGNFITFMQSQ